MRRNDKEFKAELMLRVKEYKAKQKKRRENALRVASVAVMVCVLVVSSQWGKIVDEDWYRPTDQSEAGGLTESQEVLESDSVTEDVEGITGNHTETEPVEETESAEVIRFSSVSIWEQKIQFNSAGESGPSNGAKNYEDEGLAETLLDFLEKWIETAKKISEESTSVESDSSQVSLGKKFRITFNYADGRAIVYQVAEGNGELKIKGGRLIFDQETWKQLMQILEGR